MSERTPRVASLLPSATEIVCALGLGDALVGVSHECDFPPQVVGRPVLTSTTMSPGRCSVDIDRDVRRLLRDALAVYEIDVDALERASPDVIVTQDLCDVCAVSRGDVLAALAQIARPDVRVVNLHPLTLDDVRADVLRVGAALDRRDEAARVVAAMDARLDALRARTSGNAHRPNVLTLEWLVPPMVGGTWMPELVAIAGGTALVTKVGERAPTLDAEALAALDPAPDVVLVKPCGFPLERTLAERDVLDALLAPLPWPALRDGAVWLADGNAFFNRPGPRLVDSAEILAACIHPGPCADLAERHAGSFVRFVPRGV
ncbi:MAG: ABC transporter substrate-binding protein [Planctomycetes bacterium]|nr:ABC transporter substrate-binding protein [Planctomycetota bacterium]